MKLETPEQAESFKPHVQDLLGQQCREKHLSFGLTIVEFSQEADWTYFVVKPDQDSIRIYDYADVLSNVETHLRRDEQVETVLLVPALAA